LYEVWDTITLSCRVKKAKDIKVGDILKLHENQRVPCDSLLLQVRTKTGITFIRTDQLDGETDWKMR
jgi:phospholipid-translocating ATPase